MIDSGDLAYVFIPGCGEFIDSIECSLDSYKYRIHRVGSHCIEKTKNDDEFYIIHDKYIKELQNTQPVNLLYNVIAYNPPDYTSRCIQHLVRIDLDVSCVAMPLLGEILGLCGSNLSLEKAISCLCNNMQRVHKPRISPSIVVDKLTVVGPDTFLDKTRECNIPFDKAHSHYMAIIEDYIDKYNQELFQKQQQLREQLRQMKKCGSCGKEFPQSSFNRSYCNDYCHNCDNFYKHKALSSCSVPDGYENYHPQAYY